MDFDRFKVKGPGNSSGGYGEFFCGLVMVVAGAYFVLQNVRVHSGFGSFMGGDAMGPLFGICLLGIVFLFFDSGSWIGWGILAVAGGALLVGLLGSLKFYWRSTSALQALLMFGLPAAGLGLMAAGLREHGD